METDWVLFKVVTEIVYIIQIMGLKPFYGKSHTRCCAGSEFAHEITTISGTTSRLHYLATFIVCTQFIDVARAAGWKPKI
jgi:hypothetical protein